MIKRSLLKTVINFQMFPIRNKVKDQVKIMKIERINNNKQ